MEQFSEEDNLRSRFLTFLVDMEIYAIEISAVREILLIQSIQPYSRLPEMPEYIKGIINLRGKIISLMDVRLRLGKPAAEYDHKTCIIVMETNRGTLGLIVDDVSAVITVDNNNIAAPPDFDGNPINRYVKAIGVIDNYMHFILDCEKLVNGTT